MKIIKKAIPVTFMALMVFGCGTEPPACPVPPCGVVKDDPFSKEMLEALIDKSKVVNYTETFRDVVNPDVTVGKSLLYRDENGVAMSLKSDQRKGHTAIILWFVFNFPENCFVPGACSAADFGNGAVGADALFAAGAEISEDDGIGSFSAYLREGDITGSIFPIDLGHPGLIDAQTAEIGLVVYSNGPKIPGQIEDQISQFEGGCVNRLSEYKIPSNEGECALIQFSRHKP